MLCCEANVKRREIHDGNPACGFFFWGSQRTHHMSSDPLSFIFISSASYTVWYSLHLSRCDFHASVCLRERICECRTPPEGIRWGICPPVGVFFLVVWGFWGPFCGLFPPPKKKIYPTRNNKDTLTIT